MTFSLLLRPLASLAGAWALLIGVHGLFTQDSTLLGQLVLATVTIIGFWVSSRERRAHRELLRSEIELARLQAKEGVNVAQDAYHEANNVNQKIADLQRQLVPVTGSKPADQPPAP